jgi:hypothetical protein
MPREAISSPPRSCAVVAPGSSGASRRSTPKLREAMSMAALAVAILGAAAAQAYAGDCLRELDRRGVTYKRVHKTGIAIGVEPTSPLGGVTYTSTDQHLWMDCSLAVSLDEAGPYLTALGIDHAEFLSLYSRRDVRGTHQASKHSYALAIDVARFSGPSIGTLDVALDFEQGLGDAVDCIGQPLTENGRVLETLKCQLVQSGLFFLVLTPDYDDSHFNHYHLEARAWSERSDLRASTPAIH